MVVVLNDLIIIILHIITLYVVTDWPIKIHYINRQPYRAGWAPRRADSVNALGIVRCFRCPIKRDQKCETGAFLPKNHAWCFYDILWLFYTVFLGSPGFETSNVRFTSLFRRPNAPGDSRHRSSSVPVMAWTVEMATCGRLFNLIFKYLQYLQSNIESVASSNIFSHLPEAPIGFG